MRNSRLENLSDRDALIEKHQQVFIARYGIWSDLGIELHERKGERDIMSLAKCGQAIVQCSIKFRQRETGVVGPGSQHTKIDTVGAE